MANNGFPSGLPLLTSTLMQRPQAPADNTSTPKVTVDDIVNRQVVNSSVDDKSGLGSNKIAGTGQWLSSIGTSRHTAGQGGKGKGLFEKGGTAFLFSNNIRPAPDAIDKVHQNALQRRQVAAAEAAKKGQGQHFNGLG